MADQVNEVMLERQRLSRHDSRGAVLSALGHLAVLALIYASITAAPSDPKKFVSIRLTPAAPRASRASKLPAKPAVPKAATPPTPAVGKALGKPAPLAPVSKGLFGKSTQQPKPAVPVPASSVSPKGAVTTTNGAFTPPSIGAAGITGLDTSFPFTPYIERMITLVGRRWYRPDINGDLLVTLNFSIQRDGTISDVKIENPSGSDLFDRAAYRALIETSPLPPLPFGYSGSFLGVHLSFH